MDDPATSNLSAHDEADKLQCHEYQKLNAPVPQAMVVVQQQKSKNGNANGKSLNSQPGEKIDAGCAAGQEPILEILNSAEFVSDSLPGRA